MNRKINNMKHRMKNRERHLKDGIDYEGIKYCSCCEKDWPRTHFSIDYGKKDGLQAWCKYCDMKNKAENYKGKKDKSMAISCEEYHFILDLNCIWCGKDGGSVDRWHSFKNYCPENVVPSCFLCNKFKSDLPVKKFIDYIIYMNPNWSCSLLYDEHYELLNPPLNYFKSLVLLE